MFQIQVETDAKVPGSNPDLGMYRQSPVKSPDIKVQTQEAILEEGGWKKNVKEWTSRTQACLNFCSPFCVDKAQILIVHLLLKYSSKFVPNKTLKTIES